MIANIKNMVSNIIRGMIISRLKFIYYFQLYRSITYKIKIKRAQEKIEEWDAFESFYRDWSEDIKAEIEKLGGTL